jgi:hypothetical protein
MPRAQDFEIISKIVNMQPIARGLSVRDRDRLNRTYAPGRRVRWLKRKGFATVRYTNGEDWYAEVHWYEAHGLGRVEEKVTRRIRRMT